MPKPPTFHQLAPPHGLRPATRSQPPSHSSFCTLHSALRITRRPSCNHRVSIVARKHRFSSLRAQTSLHQLFSPQRMNCPSTPAKALPGFLTSWPPYKNVSASCQLESPATRLPSARLTPKVSALK